MVSMKRCGSCGTDNSDENKFCIKCGSALAVNAVGTAAQGLNESKHSNKGMVAVLLNFFILWGLGYWYLGIKKVFGLPWYALAVVHVLLWTVALSEGDSSGIILVIVLLNFAFAYDVYQKGSGKDGWVSYQR
jgi:uncharacterized membrane protein YvbJ